MSYSVPPVGRIEVELTSACQLFCKYCPLTVEQDYRGHHLAFDRFIAILEQVESATVRDTYFSLNGFGEFFIYPYYKNVTDELARRRRSFTFHTNGIDMDVDYLSDLVSDSPDDDPITVTVKCGRVYREEEAVENCIELIAKRPKSKIQFQSLYGRNERLVKACEEAGIEATQIIVDNWAGYFEFSPSNLPDLGCERFFPSSQISITVMGEVSVCCKDFRAERGRLGNIYTNTLLDIIHGSEYQEWLESAVAHRLEDRALCKGCFRAWYTEGVAKL